MTQAVCKKLPKPKSLGQAMATGGMWYGSLCLPKLFTDLILIILFPPLFVFFHERESGFKDISIIINIFFLTCLFYFPGMIHALYIRKKGCGIVGSLKSGRFKEATETEIKENV